MGENNEGHRMLSSRKNSFESDPQSHFRLAISIYTELMRASVPESKASWM